MPVVLVTMVRSISVLGHDATAVVKHEMVLGQTVLWRRNRIMTVTFLALTSTAQ